MAFFPLEGKSESDIIHSAEVTIVFCYFYSNIQECLLMILPELRLTGTARKTEGKPNKLVPI